MVKRTLTVTWLNFFSNCLSANLCPAQLLVTVCDGKNENRPLKQPTAVPWTSL